MDRAFHCQGRWSNLRIVGACHDDAMSFVGLRIHFEKEVGTKLSERNIDQLIKDQNISHVEEGLQCLGRSISPEASLRLRRQKGENAVGYGGWTGPNQEEERLSCPELCRMWQNEPSSFRNEKCCLSRMERQSRAVDAQSKDRIAVTRRGTCVKSLTKSADHRAKGVPNVL